MEKLRSIVWTSFFALCIFMTAKVDAIVIDTEGQPTIGNPQAKVHLVAFEDPKCPFCKLFTTETLPKIKEEFLNTGKVRYTVIPVAFLPNSMPAAIALLAVYHNDDRVPNRALFFTYLDYMYAHQPDEDTNWATVSLLTNFASQASKEIDLDKLKSAIVNETYLSAIEKNTNYGKQLMGGTIHAPRLYINGVMMDDLSNDAISKRIQEALGDH